MKGIDVKRIVKYYGYSQAQIAKFNGMKTNALNEALQKENIKIELLQKIARAINKDVSVFFNDGKIEPEQIKQANEIYKRTLNLYESILCLLEKINTRLEK